MKIREKIMELEFIRDYILVSKFGNNIHYVDLAETIETGVVNRLMLARELGIDYAVVVSGIIPIGRDWDKYGDGTWKPQRFYIATDDIKTQDNNRDQEERKIYDFLRGKPIEKGDFDSIITTKEQATSKSK